VGVRFGNDTRPVKKRRPDSQLFALRLTVLSPVFISTKGNRKDEESRNRSAKMRVMCVNAITRIVLIEECYADAVTRMS